jgi:hypothetical protein
VTDAERLEWACEVLNREGHRGHYEWVIDGQRVACYGRYLELDEAIPIALALDEQSRRKLPMSEQAEWAAAELTSRVSSCAPCRAASAQGSWFCSDKFGRVRWAKEAIAIAESLVRREMLGDTSDENPKGVTS